MHPFTHSSNIYLICTTREYTERWGIKKWIKDSGQDGGIGKHSLPSHTTTTKITTKLQNNYNPESSENWAVWKSDNQGIKEITFIQQGRRGGDTRRHTGTEWAVTHLCVLDKNWERSLRSKGSQPNTRPPSPGFQCREDKSPEFLAVKTSEGGVVEETVGFSGISS